MHFLLLLYHSLLGFVVIQYVKYDLAPSSGRGEDKAGVFVVRGRVEEGGGGVTFVKDYCDGSHTGVQYEGGLAGDTVTGHYTFTYKTFLVNMNIKEKFSMTITK